MYGPSLSREPHPKKTCLRGFHPGLTQTRLYSHRKMAVGALDFIFKDKEGLYYLCSKNKGTGQLRGYGAANLCLCFRMCKNNRFSHDGAHISIEQPHG